MLAIQRWVGQSPLEQQIAALQPALIHMLVLLLAHRTAIQMCYRFQVAEFQYLHAIQYHRRNI